MNNTQSLIHPVRITDTLTLPGNILLAPVAGFTDAAFRSLCHEYGAYFSYTEMVSSQGLARKNVKTMKLIEPGKNEGLFGVQIFASDPEVAVKSAKQIVRCNPALIDLNCGCSIPKILKSGSGASLLANPGLIARIISAIKDATGIPITLKIRSGISSSSINFIEVGLLAQEAGASLITLHPRTKAEVFHGKANWDHIRVLKETLSIPVIGSGDLFTPEDTLGMLETTGCDGVMLARGAIGNPQIFRHTIDLLREGSYHTEEGEEKLKIALKHLLYMIEAKGEKRACIEMRKHFCAYTKGLANSAFIRSRVIKASTREEYEAIVGEYFAKSGEK